MTEKPFNEARLQALELIVHELLAELVNGKIAGGVALANEVKRKAIAAAHSMQANRSDLPDGLAAQVEAVCSGIKSDRLDGR